MTKNTNPNGDRDELADLRVALITGAGRRLGAAVAASLHGAGYKVVLHHRASAAETEALCSDLNRQRPDSAHTLYGDLREIDGLETLVTHAASHWGGLSALINNASTFFPTPLSQATAEDWDALMTTNLKAPFFLSIAAAPFLARNNGSIVNLGDIHAERMLPDHSIYSISKAGLHALTKSLAKELAPGVRVNAVAPGAILWPESGAEADAKEQILSRVPLQRTGNPSDIADAVLYLADRAPYVTGQVLAVDGGRLLFN